MFPSSLPRLVPLLASAFFLFGVLPSAFAAPAPIDRIELERAYRGWSGAMLNRNFAQWERYTASHRQVLTHNYVVSRKATWPDAIFQLPFRLPEITTLAHVATLHNGPTANLIYYGKVDFGVLDGIVPENLLMLRFVREGDEWKFDNTRFFNLESDPEVRLLLRRGDLAFLEDEEFQPTGEVPPVPRKIRSFDFAGEIWVASVGYETTVRIGDLHQTIVGNNAVTDVIVGGLSKAGLPIHIETREIPLPPDVPRQLQIEVYALRPPKKAARVWQFKPAPEEIPQHFEAKVYANAVTMP